MATNDGRVFCGTFFRIIDNVQIILSIIFCSITILLLNKFSEFSRCIETGKFHTIIIITSDQESIIRLNDVFVSLDVVNLNR